MSQLRSIHEFQLWLENQSIYVNHDAVQIKEEWADSFSSFWSIYATNDIASETCLAWIPASIVLSPKNSILSCVPELEEISSGLALVIVVAYERLLLSRSKWAQYLCSLPTKQYLPVLWSDHELSSLHQTPLFDAIHQDKQFLEEDYMLTVKPLMEKYPQYFQEHVIQLEDFINAASLISSRDFFISEEHGRALVPFADIFNHKCCIVAADQDHILQCEASSDVDEEIDSVERLDVSSVDPERRLEITICFETNESGESGLMIKAAKFLAKGQEIHNCYGELSNEQLLMKYGFCLEYNIFDYASLDACLLLNELEKVVMKDENYSAIHFESIRALLNEEGITIFCLFPNGASCSCFASVIKCLLSKKELLSSESVDLDFSIHQQPFPEMNSRGKLLLASVLSSLMNECYSSKEPLTLILFKTSCEILKSCIQTLEQSLLCQNEKETLVDEKQPLNNSLKRFDFSHLKNEDEKEQFIKIWCFID